MLEDECIIEDEEERPVDKWTIDEVVNWAEKIVSEKHAVKLREQEIDGKALLKQTKDDLKSYGIPGGPSTNLFEAIQILNPQIQVDKSLTHWEDVYEEYKHFYNYEFNKNSIIKPLSTWINLTSNPLYVRESYVDIFNEVEKCRGGDTFKGTLITGSPGIGKSYFLNHCISCYLKQNLTVLFQSASQEKFIFFKNSKEIFKISRDCHPFKPKVDVYIVDAGHPEWPPVPDIFHSTFTIIATSPEESHYKEFLKLSPTKTLWMPIWSIEELSTYNSMTNILDGTELETRYHYVGGIPRYIFSPKNNYVSERSRYESAVQTCSINSFNEYIGTSRIIEITHRIFQYYIGSDYETKFHCFSSEYVKETLPTLLEFKEKQGLVTLVNKTLVDIAHAAALRGTIFKSLSHSSLKAGGTFKVRDCSSSLDLPNTMEEMVEMKRSVFGFKLSTGYYYRPKAKNNKGYDSFVLKDDGKVKTLIAFQMTVSQKHSFSLNFADTLLESSKADKMDVFFVVPSNVFSDFALPDNDCSDGRITINVLEMIVS